MARHLRDGPPLRDLLDTLRETQRSDKAVRRPRLPCPWMQRSAMEAIPELLRQIVAEPDYGRRASLQAELDAAIDLAARPIGWDDIDDPMRNMTPAKRRAQASAG